VPDTQPKQAAATAALRSAANRIAHPALVRLEAAFLEETLPNINHEQQHHHFAYQI
jgi:hypothetical protein